MLNVECNENKISLKRDVLISELKQIIEAQTKERVIITYED